MSTPRLAPCPPTPNCVSTQADPGDRIHRIEPLRFACDPTTAMETVLQALGSLPRCRVRERDDVRVHAVVTSRLWRFKDDVEVVIDAQERLIHLRSASRVGKGDLGVNRRRAVGLFAAIAPRVGA